MNHETLSQWEPVGNKSTKRNLLLYVPFGLISLFYLPNVIPVIQYWIFEVTHPSTWGSFNYWLLGTLFDGLLAFTFLGPLWIASAAEKSSADKEGLGKILPIFGFLVLSLVASIIAATISGYIGPNYLQEFYIWRLGGI